jgi:NAD(P)-dependent dehydrogenase (short-subunit alcohol dehydrogenase family)
MTGLGGKLVVITGAAGGLGTALARAFAKEGCQLFLTDCRPRQLEKLIAEIAMSGVLVHGEATDISKVHKTQDLINRAFQTLGGIDVLINNAGISSVKSLWDIDETDWDSVLNVNVKGLFFTFQAAARHMLERGGSIINITSVAGRGPRPAMLHYAASKAAVISITRSAALALARSRIRVNAIAPGMMDTEMLDKVQSSFSNTTNSAELGQPPSRSSIPLGRIAQPDEVAGAAIFLASDAGSYITGQTLNVCGGIMMS